MTVSAVAIPSFVFASVCDGRKLIVTNNSSEAISVQAEANSGGGLVNKDSSASKNVDQNETVTFIVDSARWSGGGADGNVVIKGTQNLTFKYDFDRSLTPGGGTTHCTNRSSAGTVSAGNLTITATTDGSGNTYTVKNSTTVKNKTK